MAGIRKIVEGSSWLIAIIFYNVTIGLYSGKGAAKQIGN